MSSKRRGAEPKTRRFEMRIKSRSRQNRGTSNRTLRLKTPRTPKITLGNIRILRKEGRAQHVKMTTLPPSGRGTVAHTSSRHRRPDFRSRTHNRHPKVQIYGNNKGKVIPVETDKLGRLITVPVYKKTKKMRNTRIFGTHDKNPRPIKVDREDRLETQTKVDVHVKGMEFVEIRERVTTMDDFVPLPLENISHSIQYVYLVRNAGTEPAEVYVEVGTDCESLTPDIEGVQTVKPGATVIVTPLQFSKYIRLLYKSATAGKCTKLFVVFQAQIFS